jgi:hypothetical protein
MPDSILYMPMKPSLSPMTLYTHIRKHFSFISRLSALLYCFTVYREDEDADEDDDVLDDDIEKENEKTILIGASLISCTHTHSSLPLLNDRICSNEPVG